MQLDFLHCQLAIGHQVMGHLIIIIQHIGGVQAQVLIMKFIDGVFQIKV